MKARLLQKNGKIELLLCTGIVKNTSQAEAKEFILHFDDPEIYSGPGDWDYDGISMEDYSGDTIVSIDDNGSMTVIDGETFRNILSYEPANLLTVPEYAALHGKKTAIVRRFCLDGRIEGAIQKGTRWLIPADSPYPCSNT